MRLVHTKFQDNLITVGDVHYLYDAGVFGLPTDLVPVNLDVTRDACLYCKNYNNNGGCPPYANTLHNIKKKYQCAYIFYIRFPVYNGPIRTLIDFDENKRIRRWMMFVRWWDFVFSPMIRRVTSPILKDINNHMVLWYGNCRVCSRCIFRDQAGPCRYPHKREFSLESTGVRVDQLMQMVGIETQWFLKKKKGGLLRKWADYLYKAMAILTTEPLDRQWLVTELQKELRKQYNR